MLQSFCDEWQMKIDPKHPHARRLDDFPAQLDEAIDGLTDPTTAQRVHA